MSTFGSHYRVTTFGESHCKSVGCIVDGVPAGLDISEDLIQTQLSRRRPGQSNLTTPRDEKDRVEIQSGVEAGVTLGTPICLMVKNLDQKPNDYRDQTLNLYPRPSHSDYTYLRKYGVKASSGGGRSSARETIGRVAASAIAEHYLQLAHGIQCVAFVSSIGNVHLPRTASEARRQGQQYDAELDLTPPTSEYGEEDGITLPTKRPRKESHRAGKVQQDIEDGNITDVPFEKLLRTVTRAQVDGNLVRCPDAETAARMTSLVEDCRDAHDSVGGTVTCVIRGVPAGLGEPAFDKLEALLAHAMLSIPATKGFEFGSGFAGAAMRGSEHNDAFVANNTSGAEPLSTLTNRSGGIQGGISNGQDIYFTVAFKPAATISQAQPTSQYDGTTGTLITRGRHDPCVLPRAVPIVESMASLVIMDTLMAQQGRSAAFRALRSADLDPQDTKSWDSLPESMRPTFCSAGGSERDGSS